MNKEAKIIEYVTFKVKENISDKEFLKAAFKTDKVLKQIVGFISRDIAKQDDNTWVEVVYWEDKEFAKQGLEKFLKDPLSEVFLEMIISESINIEYSNICKNNM